MADTENNIVIKPTDEQIALVEKAFIEVIKRDFIKYGSVKYKEAERFYFCGAIMAFNFSVVKWSVNMMTRRPVLEKEKFK